MKPIAYGIDFGTTNCVLAVSWPDRIDVMPGFPEPLLRSAVYLDRGGTRTAGENALRQFLARPEIRVARLFLELKATLSDPGLDRIDLFGRNERLEHVVAVILRYLKLLADRETEAEVDRLVLGFPVAFPEAEGARFEELQSLALERLCDAANIAGFTDVVPLEEPAAAAGDEEAELFATIDFGGGTFDVAIVRNGVDAEILSLTGASVGGEELTSLLFGASMTPYLGLDHPRLPNRYVENTKSLAKVLALLFADDLSPSGIRPFAPRYADIMEGGFLYDLYSAVEAAKIELSEAESAVISLRKRGIEVTVPVEREMFEDVIAGPLDRIDREMDRAALNANVDVKDVELVTLTGGSSRIPAFRQRVIERFPRAQIADRDPYTMVAAGLARRAREVQW